MYAEATGSGKAELGRELGAVRRHPRPLLLCILSCLDIARYVARRRFSRLQPEMSTQAARHLLERRVSRCGSLCVCCCPQVLIHTIILTILYVGFRTAVLTSDWRFSALSCASTR